jgi:hypothetical protein
MLKAKLELLTKEFTLLKEKITTKLQTQQEANQKVETLTKENSENEKVLEQLIKEFQELIKAL